MKMVSARPYAYTFDPANFPDSPEAQQSTTKLVLAPGPNNPVGMVWIGRESEFSSYPKNRGVDVKALIEDLRRHGIKFRI